MITISKSEIYIQLAMKNCSYNCNILSIESKYVLTAYKLDRIF